MTDTLTAVDVAGYVPAFDVADRLTKALRESEMSHQEMADYLGISRNTVSAYVNGRSRPKRAYVLLWALRTGVDAHWLETGRTRRDSNSQPSDWESDGGQVVALDVWRADREAVAS